MLKKIVLGIVILMLSGLLCTAGTHTHKDAGMSIWFPDDWKVTADGDMLEATSPGEHAYVQLMALDVETLDDAVETYTKEIDKIVKNFKTTSEGENKEANGLSIFYIDGNGFVEGVKMDITIALAVTKKAIVMIVAFSTDEHSDEHDEDIDDIYDSMKAI